MQDPGYSGQWNCGKHRDREIVEKDDREEPFGTSGSPSLSSKVYCPLCRVQALKFSRVPSDVRLLTRRTKPELIIKLITQE